MSESNGCGGHCGENCCKKTGKECCESPAEQKRLAIEDEVVGRYHTFVLKMGFFYLAFIAIFTMIVEFHPPCRHPILTWALSSSAVAIIYISMVFYAKRSLRKALSAIPKPVPEFFIYYGERSMRFNQ